ncbi:MAG: hypothetical protein IKE09_10595 [Clostridiales bacterium]|nr:hypothetical protein [Clostridiales bacterium]
MTGLINIAGTWIWYVICVVALILFVGSLAVLFSFLMDKRRVAPVIIVLLNLLMTGLVIVVLMDCGKYFSDQRVYRAFQIAMFEVPYQIYLMVELISCVALFAMVIEGAKYRTDNVTPDSIQQAIDALPDGISISSKDGIVRLSNLKINTLSRALTGKVLTNAELFWDAVIKNGKEQGGSFLVDLPDNEVWLFTKEDLRTDDADYDQITSMNVTERYKIIRELEEKHGHLQDIRRRMKEVSDLSGDMFIAQEEADARAALHNQLGQVLLMGRYYINHQDITDPKMVYAATRQMNQFLLGEAKEPYQGEEDSIIQAVSMAGSIGIKVIMNGPAPENNDVRKILSKAITECAANTIKHAEGNTITVNMSADNGRTLISITNNGKPPKGEITESGGLLSLRRDVENLGGSVQIESEPEFNLIMRF